MRVVWIAVVILLLAAFSSGSDFCIADGSPELKESGDIMCSWGFFEKVHMTQDVNAKTFKGFVVLNQDGIEMFGGRDGRDTLWELASGLLIIYGKDKYNGSFEFRYEHDVVSQCVIDLEAREVSCEAN